jgi:O-antigen ligase
LRYTSEDATVIARGTENRVASTTGHPIEFGVVSSMVLPLALHYGYRAREQGLPALRWWLCAAMIASGLAFSVSRSAVLTVAAVGLVLFFGWPARRRVQALVVAVLFVGVVKVMSPGLVGTIYKLFANAGTDSSVQVRTHRYSQAGEEISKHLLLGRGAGTWYYPKYNAFDNQYIMSMVETGVIGTAALVLIFLCGFYAATRARRLSTDPGTRDLGLTLAACLASPMVGAVTFDMLSFATVTGLSFLLIGLCGALLRAAQQEEAAADGRPRTLWESVREVGARVRPSRSSSDGPQPAQGSGRTVDVTR